MTLPQTHNVASSGRMMNSDLHIAVVADWRC
jgi:hypothetical protein